MGFMKQVHFEKIPFLLNIPLVLLLYHATTSVFCQVENEILQYDDPRVFNPHPYEALVQGELKKYDPGPVLFPKTPGDDDPLINNKYNIVNIESIRMLQEERDRQQRVQLGNNIDDVTGVPYAQVADQIKLALARRKFDNRENEILDPQTYEELARHGVKIVNFSPPPQHNKIVEDKRKPFGFSYKVLDRETGDDFSHRQVQNSRDTKGEYRVKLPDGRLQIVSYTAGKNGFNADVKYIQEVSSNDQNVHIERIPVKELGNTVRVPSVLQSGAYKNLRNEQQVVGPLKSHGLVGELEKIAGPTEIPVNYVDVTPVTPSHASIPDVTGVPYLGHRLKPTVSPVINYPKAVFTKNHKEKFAYYNPAGVDPPVYHRTYNPIRYTSTTAIPPPQRSLYKQAQQSSVEIQPIQVVQLAQQPVYTTFAPIRAPQNSKHSIRYDYVPQAIYTTVPPVESDSHARQPIYKTFSPQEHAQNKDVYLKVPQPTYRPLVLNPKPEIINYGDHGLFNPTDPDYLRQRQIQEHISSSSSTSTTTTLAPIVVADEESLVEQPLEHSYKPLVLRRNGKDANKLKGLESIYFIDKAQRDHIKK